MITGQLKLIESSLKCSETKSSMCKAFEKIQESVSTLKMMHELLDSESFEFESYSGERNILKLHDK